MKQDLNKRQIRDWPVVGELLFIQCRFLKQWRDDRFRESGMKLARSEGEVDNVVSFCGQPHYCNHPNVQQPGFDLPRHTWYLMNCFRTGL